MMRVIQYLFFCFLISLSACGGGSGGSSGAGSTPSAGVTAPPPVETGTIDVSQSAVNFSARQFGGLPASQILTVDVDAPLVTAGTLPGEVLPSWLDVSLTQSGDASGRLQFTIRDTNLAPDTYTTTVRLVSSDAAGNNVMDTVDIPVTYIIEPITPLEINVSLLEVNLAPIDDPVTRTITLTGEGVSWDIRNFDPVVVSVSPSSGIVPAGGQEIEITVTPDRREFERSTRFFVTFFEDGTPENSAELDIVVNLSEGVVTDPENLSFRATEGSIESQSQTVIVDNFESGGDSQINWTASSDQTWLTANPLSGTINTGDEDSNITITADPTGLSIGLFEGTITFTNDVSDQVLTLPVTLVVGERAVTTSRRGVALSNLSTLEQEINVTDGSGAGVPWEATSNAPWLSVAPSGAAGESLIVTADTEGLAADSLFEATVTLTSSLSDITNEVSLNVGLWNSSGTSEEVSVELPGEDSFGAPDVFLVDPVRPYVYVLVFDGFETGFNITSSLSSFNVYTGELVAGPIQTRIPDESKLIISDDGSSLFVVPSSFDGSDRQFERFNPADLTPLNLTDLPAEFILGEPEFTRVNGIPLLISGSGGVFDLETGALLSELNGVDGFELITSQTGTACARSNIGLSTMRLDCFDLLGTGVAGMDIAANRRNTLPIGDNPIIEGISPDGSVIYIREGSEVLALTTDESQTQRFSLENVDQLFVSPTGLLGTFGMGDPTLIQGVISIFDENGALINMPEAVDGFDQFAAFSGDSGRIILFDALLERRLTFVDVP